MPLEEPGDRGRRPLLALDAGEQGAHAAQGEVRVERRPGHAGGVGPGRELVGVLAVRRDDRAADPRRNGR
jgi:hypothetical protein